MSSLHIDRVNFKWIKGTKYNKELLEKIAKGCHLSTSFTVQGDSNTFTIYECEVQGDEEDINNFKEIASLLTV